MTEAQAKRGHPAELPRSLAREAKDRFLSRQFNSLGWKAISTPLALLSGPGSFGAARLRMTLS